MYYKRLCVLVYTCLHLLCVECEVKSSLVFVIDDTGSMSGEIAQVKQRVYEVFDAVLSSNGSVIDEFVLVTFNDPTTALRIITTDRDAYKSAVSAIRVNGGGDCPEMALAGIELGLQNSKPNSFLYVFTDASAKDYNLYERVKSLSQKKSTQVTFLLTGNCGDANSPEFLVYEDLAQATSGQAFNLQKQDVTKVINYIIASIKHKRTTVYQQFFEVSGEVRVTFIVDIKMWDVMIAISASSIPTISVIDNNGIAVTTEVIADASGSSVIKLNTTSFGVYTAIMNINTATSVIVTGSTSVSFQHGFSTVQPTSIIETSTKPIGGQLSFLAILLDNVDRDILLLVAELRDESDKIIMEVSLKLISEVDQFYITEAFLPPNVTFKIAVNGNTLDKQKITRVSSTTIEYQKPALEETKNLAPTVTILGDPKVEVEYNKNLTLKCKVNGYPKSDIFWINENGDILPSTVNPIDLPYDYMSIVNIAKVDRNQTFVCKANNSIGESNASISASVTFLFNVLDYPKDVTLKYEGSANFSLLVYATIGAQILWYKNGEMLSAHEHIQFSEDRSILTIEYMVPELAGNYTVEAVNQYETKSYSFQISISGTEMPVINKTISNYHAKSGTNVTLSCSVISGVPTPTFTWGIDREQSGSFEELQLNNIYEEDYYIQDVTQYGGRYRCTASNYLGEDSHEMNLYVENATWRPCCNWTPITIIISILHTWIYYYRL